VWVVAANRAGAAMKMMSTVDRGPGWTIIAPAVTRDGKTLLVDLGQVPDQKLAEVSMPEAETEIIGIVRLHNGGKAYFDPPNDPSGNLWYWWDRPAMLAAAGAVDGAASHPFVVQRIPQPSDQGFPRPAEPKANLRNNHLGYAITWFGLAAVLVVMTAIYVRGQMKKSAA
jgi:surfeit locus 1 family protein